MDIQITMKEFRHLLDLIYIGNWILNSTRANDRFEDYDLLQEKFLHWPLKTVFRSFRKPTWVMFSPHVPMRRAVSTIIADYEDAVFFDILAEELARRDMTAEQLNPNDIKELHIENGQLYV